MSSGALSASKKILSPFHLRSSMPTAISLISLRLANVLVFRAFQMLEQEKGIYELEQPEPDLLAHYTSTKTALSILEGEDLWLFDLTTSNDPEEQILGLKDAFWAVDQAWNITYQNGEALDGFFDEPWESINLDWVSRIGRSLQSGLLRRSMGRAFGCSFVRHEERADSLAMWRSYADDATGVALEFYRADIAYHATEHNFHLFPVVYLENDFKALCRFLCIAVYELLADTLPTNAIRQMAQISQNLHHQSVYAAGRMALNLLATLRKHPDYRYENEARIVTIAANKSNVKTVKNGKYSKRDYLSLHGLIGKPNPLPVASVRLGPRAGRTQNVKRIINWCKQHGVRVTESSIRYRGADPAIEQHEDRVSRFQRAIGAAGKLERRHSNSSECRKAYKEKVLRHWDSLNEMAQHGLEMQAIRSWEDYQRWKRFLPKDHPGYESSQDKQ